MSKVLTTPGVYIEEKNAFSTSISAVPTAIAGFIGYTEKAIRGTKSLTGRPIRINSFAEFVRIFGGAPKTTYTISPDDVTGYSLAVDEGTEYYLFNSIKLFYSNGGGTCYIVSVGGYGNGIKSDELTEGLHQLLNVVEPKILLAPDAMLLEAEDAYTFQREMIKHCGSEMRNRVCILDVHNGYKARTMEDDDVISQFRTGVGERNLGFASAYYPWLNTTVTSKSDVNYENISNIDGLQAILNKEVEDGVASETLRAKRADAIKVEIGKLSDPDANKGAVAKTLNVVSPTFRSVLGDVRRELNVLPPSGAMAGIYAFVDDTQGVSRSPANVSLNGVTSPSVSINNEIQEDLNVPLNGKAVNAIRGFFGKGVLVWGARTLDGNSLDWRYISVRRAILMIEESIKNTLDAYIFEPNDQNTWLDIEASVTGFLTTMWNQGVLVGGTPAEAFEVALGLGITMTPQDILDGIMRINIKLAVVRPAEFIIVTFQQMLQGGGGTEDSDSGAEGGGDSGE